MIRLDSGVFVARRQLRVSDLSGAVAAGIRTIVNNRPDGEEPGQPSSDEMESAARALGLDYRHIPVDGALDDSQVAAMAEAVESGPVLAFCRSGTRSTYLWALARASRGADGGALIRRAAEAGYDLSPIAARLIR